MAVGESVPLNSSDADARWKADIARRIADLERQAQRSTTCGFYVSRTTNDTPVGPGQAIDITFNNVIEQHWSTFAGFTSGAGLTVPPEGAGMYMMTAGIYYPPGAVFIYPAITVNGYAVAGDTGPNLLRERSYISGEARLVPGDVLRLHIGNFNSAGGTTVTPTAFPVGDPQTTVLPFLKAWRIST